MPPFPCPRGAGFVTFDVASRNHRHGRFHRVLEGQCCWLVSICLESRKTNFDVNNLLKIPNNLDAAFFLALIQSLELTFFLPVI